jgi:hypothetical protein
MISCAFPYFHPGNSDYKNENKKGLQDTPLSCKPFLIYWRRHPDLNRRMEVLQTSALPLGYAALKKNGAGNGI